MPDIDVNLSGPFFSGVFPQVMDDICRESEEEIGAQALERVQFYLNAQIKHPTPYYETQIMKQQSSRGTVVHDRGIVYGPWLEGTSSRNSRTRFKGYASFRKAASDTEQLVPELIAHVVARNIIRVGGTP